MKKPNVKNVLWLYNEKNDLDQLKDEIKNKILIKYLKDLNFTQKLNINVTDIEQRYREFHLELTKMKSMKETENLLDTSSKTGIRQRLNTMLLHLSLLYLCLCVVSTIVIELGLIMRFLVAILT